MINAAMAFAWLLPVAVLTPLLIANSGVKDGKCYDYGYGTKETTMGYIIWYLFSFYFVIFAIFIFGYGRILVAIRRQAKVMAGHSAAGPSTSSQTHQSNQIQTNVIKTMILVSALYVICHILQAVSLCLSFSVIYLDLARSFRLVLSSVYDASRVMQFLYVTTNPFIYAVKFDPVRKVLKGMIPTGIMARFRHAMSHVTSSGNRTATAGDSHELADMRDGE